MNKRDVFISGLTIALVLVLVLTVQATALPPQALSDQAVPIRILSVQADTDAPAAAEASDYAQRHPEVLRPENLVDLSDYYQRHPNAAVTATSTDGASDWFERHPEAIRRMGSPDLSDYYLRHPTAPQPARVSGADDYALRHLELLRRGNQVDFDGLRLDPS